MDDCDCCDVTRMPPSSSRSQSPSHRLAHLAPGFLPLMTAMAMTSSSIAEEGAVRRLGICKLYLHSLKETTMVVQHTRETRLMGTDFQRVRLYVSRPVPHVPAAHTRGFPNPCHSLQRKPLMSLLHSEKQTSFWICCAAWRNLIALPRLRLFTP